MSPSDRSANAHTSVPAPLAGLRVLDLSRLLPGAYASQILAGLGAEVLKVEEPAAGDYGRWIPPFFGGISRYFFALNCNKKSIALDLKAEAGKVAFRKLAHRADILLESFRPGVLDRLGLGYEQLKQDNPGLIYCAISGYGQDGPYRNAAGHDLNYIALAGLLHFNRGKGENPVIPASQLGDIAGGSYMAVIGILAAIAGRQHSGVGQFVDVSMVEGAMALLPMLTATYLTEGEEPAPGTTELNGALPCYAVYETSDGGYITLACLERKFWEKFCRKVNRAALIPLYSARGEAAEPVFAELTALFKSRTRAEWVEQLTDPEICFAPVNTVAEAFADPHLQARRLVQEITANGTTIRTLVPIPRLSNNPDLTCSLPPALGEHTDEVLAEAGYSVAEIAMLRQQGVAGAHLDAAELGKFWPQQ